MKEKSTQLYEYDDLFLDLSKDQSSSRNDDLITKIENDFRGISDEAIKRQDRLREKNEMIEKLERYRKLLRKCKNLKNVKSRSNASRVERRKMLRKKIEICRLRLDEIRGEEEGDKAEMKIPPSEYPL
jgi:hypothetical protein